MNKYAHIKSFEDVDAELLRLEREKALLRKQMAQNVEVAKAALKPKNIFWILAESLTSGGGKGSLPNLVIKIASEILTTVQASKYGLKLLKKLFK